MADEKDIWNKWIIRASTLNKTGNKISLPTIEILSKHTDLIMTFYKETGADD